LGAVAALASGTWYFGGYTIDEWQERAAQNPKVNNYYTTVVQPAYEQYQANPDSLQDIGTVEKG
jgi:ABC-type taurine transport system substrate-binding protein